MNLRVVRGVAVAALIFLAVQLGALALVAPFEAAGYRAVEDPSDPTNSVFYLVAILVVTALMLAAFRYDLDAVIRLVIVGAGALLSWYVFSVIVPPVVVAGVNVLAVGLSLGVAVALLAYPEWYVIDLAGVLMGAGGAGLFGISFGLLPAIVLLTALAVYDAISVYGTEHMLSLASGVLDLKVPVVLVIPLSLSYSLLDDEFTPPDPTSDADERDGEGSDVDERDGEGDEPAATRPTDGAGPVDADGGDAVDEVAATGSDDGEDGEGGGVGEDSKDGEDGGDDEEGRDAFFIGLGDAVMPTVMIASAAFYSPAAALGLPLAASANLPALLAMVGTFLGLGVLLWAVFGGRAHAGLPLLNGGAIGGYLLGSVIAGVPLTTAIGL